jgi:hypothetical protein
MSAMPPWPQWRESAGSALAAMLGELEGLPITGAEFSVRLSPAGMECGRWLAGVSPVGVAPARLQGLPARLGMPAADALWFTGHVARARQIGLALEQTAAQAVAKVYLEWPLPAPDLRPRPPELRQVALQISSCKWSLEPGYSTQGAPRQTDYWRLSGIDAPGMVELLRRPQEELNDAQRQVYTALAQCLQTAMHAAPDWREPRLLLVRDASSTRRGVGLRFYGSGLTVATALAPLKPLWRAWGVNLQAHPELLSFWADQELGWLHAGLDGQGQVFVIVYGAIDRTQARAVLSASGSAARQQAAIVQEN